MTAKTNQTSLIPPKASRSHLTSKTVVPSWSTRTLQTRKSHTTNYRI